MSWLPEGKTAAICFSVDDVHPSTFSDRYEAGGGLGCGALRFIERLIDRHPELRVTLCVTPDWRPIQLVSCRRLARLPLLSRWVYHVDQYPKGHLRVDRRPDFVRYLNGIPRTEVVVHGLHHVHRGPRLAVEFQKQSYERCAAMVRAATDLLSAAGLAYAKGFAPPGWNLPEPLSSALEDQQFSFVLSARDIRTRIEPSAKTAMSGLTNVSLIHPEIVGRRKVLVHLPVNFQATSLAERAHQIIACSGLVSIKAHIFKRGGGHTMVDGLDDAYYRRLDKLFRVLEDKYADALWWPSTSEIATRYLSVRQLPDHR